MDGMTREQRVRARKARDTSLQLARIRRQSAMSQETMSALSTRGAIGLHIVANKRTTVPLQPVNSDESLSWPDPPKTPRIVTPIQSTPSRSPRAPSVNRNSLQLPSPTLSSFKSDCASQMSHHSDAGLDLEARIQAVERKNRMLEKALIAVIRGTVGHDRRQSELQKANSLEEILRQLQAINVNTPDAPAAVAAPASPSPMVVLNNSV